MNILCCCFTMAPNTKITRKWEVFAGRNKFYCDGYCMTAPNSGVFYLTVILITVTSGLFFVFDCPFLADRISPAIPVIGGALFIFTMSSLLRTSLSDPGIIPRASSDEAAYIEKQIEVPNSLNSPTYRPPPRTKEVFVKGQTVKLKYCFTCKIFRPPRASHCSLCDNCVDRFDHHCPWVGNCVGKRNYRFFYMFIVSLAFLAVFIFACSTTHLVMSTKEKKEFIDVVKQTPSSVIVAVICFFSVWSVIGLAGFHTYLTTSDQTTNEDIKGSFTSKGGQQNANPYSQGNICLNCFHILCGPIAPSLIDRRGLVNDEFRLQMQNQYQTKPTLVVQPMRNIDSSIKQLNVDLESGNPSGGTGQQFPAGSGVYRQRSYDNLQNEKSNSSSYLVDNEVPLSNADGPLDTPAPTHMAASITTTNFQTVDDVVDSTTIDDILVDEGGENDASNLVMIRQYGGDSSSKQLTDSYNNLYRDSKQSTAGGVDQFNEIEVIDEVATASTPMRKILRENVYSNVPPMAALSSTQVTTAEISHMTVPGAQDFNKSDPNLHVYSNISSPKTALKKRNASTSSTNVSLTQMDDENSIMNSSFLLTNDLDLDDPVFSSAAATTATSSTTGTPKKIFNSTFNTPAPITASGGGRYLKQNAIKTTNITGILDATASKIAAIEMKSIQPKVDAAPTVPTVNGSSSQPNGKHSTPFISPNRRRMLHDTTMIDTALDLDSLDGSSLSNGTAATALGQTAVV